MTYPPGNYIPPGERENHLQNAIFLGYVSSLEGTPLKGFAQCVNKHAKNNAFDVTSVDEQHLASLSLISYRYAE